MKYLVTVTETRAKQYAVETLSEEEAASKALDEEGQLERDELISAVVTDIEEY